MTPWTRSFLVRARVSIPAIPGTPFSRSQSSRDLREEAWDGRCAELRDDVPGDPGPLGLEALGIDAVVADERVGLAEDLAVVGGVGDALGIADDPGIENDFPPDLGAGAETYAFEDGPVREGQYRSFNKPILRPISGAV